MTDQPSPIIDFFTRNRQDVQKIIDTSFWRLMEDLAPIDKVMPIRDYLTRKLLLMKFGHHKPTVASIVSEEQDIPATRVKAELDENLFNNLKLGKKLLFTARHFELMFEMRNYLAAGGPTANQMAAQIEKYFFGLAADLVPTVIEKATVLAFKVATTGRCIYEDPLTGGKVELTYPGLISAHLPNALTGNARWSQAATCTPLANLEAHARTYYDNLGYFPAIVIMHWATMRQVADSNELRIAKMRAAGNADADPTTTGLYIEDDEAIAYIKQRTRAREVLLFDSMYTEELKNGDQVDRKFLDDDTYFFAAEDQFERAFVPTVEKDFQQGIYYTTEVVSKAPRREHAIAVGNVIPFCADPRRIAARKVA